MDKSEIETLQIKNQLTIEFDQVIEECLLKKLPVKKALGKLLPVFCRIIGSQEILVRTTDENMKLVSLKTKNFLSVWSYLIPWKIPEKTFESKVFELDNCHLVLSSLDVVDQVIGVCGFAL